METCPLGGAHFSNPQEARQMSEVILQGTNPLFTNFSQAARKDVPARRFLENLAERTPLKDMNAERLSFALLADYPGKNLDTAVQLASLLHEGQLRGNRAGMPKTPYIEHPLRVALRIRRLGVEDESTLVSAVGHDLVEDTSKKFAKLYTGEDDIPEARAREILLDFLGNSFGPEVEETTLLVTNPIAYDLPPGATLEDEQEFYRDHARAAFAANVRTFLVKGAGDFVDNAAGLKHSTGLGLKRQGRMARKYFPLADDIDYWTDHYYYSGELPSKGTAEQIHTWMEDARRSMTVIIKASE
jgi:hypothetical protein